MTKLQELKDEVSKARQLMKHHRPNKDAMGNMYYYWESKRDEALLKIKELRN